MISEDALANLQGAIRSITKYQNVDLVRRSKWGAITFDSVEQHIDYAIDMTSILATMPLESLTDHAANELRSQMPAVADQLARVDDFAIDQGDASARRAQIETEVKRNVEQMHVVYSRWFPYLAYQRGDIDKNIKKLEDAIQQANALFDDGKTELEETKAEVTKIVDATRQAAAGAGVATFTHAFEEEAKKLEAESQKWFKGMIWCSVGTVVVITLLYFWPALSADAKTWQIVRNAFMKVSTIVVFFNCIVWCARMYRARSHQTAVNRHRALSLKTFQAFVEATDDDRTRDAVLLAATKSIFANVSTGLIEERTNHEDPSVQFLEIGKKSIE